MKYRNAKHINERGWIDCEIEHPEFGWVPYTLDPEDVDKTVDNNKLLKEMSANEDVAAYVPPTQEEIDTRLAEEIRHIRNNLLKTEVDPIAGNTLRWAELTDVEKQALSAYRQALLDVPQQSGFPNDVNWPESP